MKSTTLSSDTRDLCLFFLIAFVWTWLLNLPRLLGATGWLSLPAGVSSALGTIAVFGPALAAFGLTWLRSGKDGLRALWRRGWEISFRRIWLLPALLLMPISGLLTLGLLTAVSVPVPWEYALPPAMLVPVGLLIWLAGALPEEFGWRGYALDRLQMRLDPLPASLVLGLFWSLWHLPLHFISGTTQASLPIGEFAIQTIVLSVLYTWLYNRTGGSVLIAGLFHAAGNLTGALIPTWTIPLGRWLGLLPLLAIALMVVFSGGLRRPQV
jgi:membrane protease YdiL (CAAX protease family)